MWLVRDTGRDMAHTVTQHDLRIMVELIDHARDDAGPAGLPTPVLELTRQLIACDIVSFFEMEPLVRRTYFDQEGTSEAVVIRDGVDADTDPFWVHYWDSAPCSYASTSGDERTITTISDFYSQRQWRASGMHSDCVPDIEHEAMMCISAPAGHTRRLALSRTGNRDFDDRERLILALLRPHLDEAYQELQQRRLPRPALTGQQHRVLRLVADGLSNKQIAKELVVSAATVRTHLENIFTTLQVTSRGAAVAKAFPRRPF